jgi:hypothetical protein
MYTVKGRGVLSCSPVSIPRISLEGNNGLLNDMSVIFFWRNGFCNVVILCEEEQTTQLPKEKRTNNDLQNIHIKLKIE